MEYGDRAGGFEVELHPPSLFVANLSTYGIEEEIKVLSSRYSRKSHAKPD